MNVLTDYVLVIPARYGSTRLPAKALVDIEGKPMIARTIERAKEAVPSTKIYVATDSEEISQVAEAEGVQTIMTSVQCLTGTDRVAEVAKNVKADFYVNLQGDEPMMDAENIRKTVVSALENPGKIINGWSWIKNEADFVSRTIPKVVIRKDGQLLYMSRSPIPGTKSGSFKFARKQVCVYSFPREALFEFSNQVTKTPHEDCEDIEILRFLEMGWDVQMVELSGAFKAVDTEEDLTQVRETYAAKFGI